MPLPVPFPFPFPVPPVGCRQLSPKSFRIAGTLGQRGGSAFNPGPGGDDDGGGGGGGAGDGG